nr:immunoglobulin light chain junction region [Macaca mulatta]MOW40527.1 immunoglobulin light chain junction region [Macaca mulatta]MOW63253.1 immunoglobulin light chain junction region [Macaca mulatta]MOW65258.1 immunoglobulin light chain junction region [Macaca mulatta]MOW74917.1 immunoglobulin light chain junction region [Macaca mulatta]
CMQGLDFPFTF